MKNINPPVTDKSANKINAKLEAQQSLQRVLASCNRKGVVLPAPALQLLVQEFEFLVLHHHHTSEYILCCDPTATHISCNKTQREPAEGLNNPRRHPSIDEL